MINSCSYAHFGGIIDSTFIYAQLTSCNNTGGKFQLQIVSQVPMA